MDAQDKQIEAIKVIGNVATVDLLWNYLNDSEKRKIDLEKGIDKIVDKLYDIFIQSNGHETSGFVEAELYKEAERDVFHTRRLKQSLKKLKSE